MSESTYFDPGTGDFVALDGNVIERKSLYIVEKLKEINPDIEVLCLGTEDSSELSEEPFLICERRGDRVFKIFGVWELDDSVIERVQLADTHQYDIQKMIDDNNAKVRANQQAADREKLASRKDLVASIVADHKSSYTYTEEETGDLVTIYDDKPSERKVRE